ncbi:MAG: T9SS type A sorting domain-containing protein [Saprospiraceae bacterium]|nr:T9SS type A sorting domain-containing protein [Saprospiraceae bacterium]
MGDGAVYTSSEVTHTYASAGTYRVVLHTTDSLQCITSSARPVTVLIMSGIRQDQILSVGNVILFPNPGNQFLQGKIDELEFKQGDIAVYNSQGMRLFVQREINLQQEFRIDTAELPSGMYLIEVIAGSRRWMGRWVKHLSE